MIQLSHTAKEKYILCPMAYYMHYMLGLREERVGSPLPFGTAIDNGLNVLLNAEPLEKAIDVFNKTWEHPLINSKIVDGPTTKLIKFSKADSAEGLADTPWESMKIKGGMMLKAYQAEVMPLIKNVLAIQKPMKITDEHGNVIIGFGDLIMEHIDSRILAMDNKTSASKYAVDAVTVGDKAKQLALYYEEFKHEYNLDGAGFFVMEKKIRVNEPRARVQVLIDQVPEEIIEETFDEFEKVLYGIKMGIFPSNHPDCNTYFGECICNKYYPSGGIDMTGLIKVKKNG